MNKLGKSELDTLFLDVRKSYRLLYQYQKHVLDLVKFIGNSIGFNFRSGWSLFSNNASNGKNVKLDKWAWDWLGMYGYQFYFKDETIKDEPVRFAINLFSDTGFYDINDNKNKQDVEHFNAVDGSGTKLIFIASKGVWDWQKLFKKRNYKSGFDQKVIKEGNDITVGKAYDLSEFTNEKNTISLINSFVELCRENGLELQPELKKDR